MALKLYMDHHVPRAITIGLRMRSVDVITAHEDAAGSLSDSDLLDRAGKLGRVLFTQDDDLVVEAGPFNRRVSAVRCWFVATQERNLSLSPSPKAS
jgi:predicted nuclease of predicted toxin-antitoxin system